MPIMGPCTKYRANECLPRSNKRIRSLVRVLLCVLETRQNIMGNLHCAGRVSSADRIQSISFAEYRVSQDAQNNQNQR